MLLYNVSLGKPTRCASKIIVWDAAPIGHETCPFWNNRVIQRWGEWICPKQPSNSAILATSLGFFKGTSVKWHTDFRCFTGPPRSQELGHPQVEFLYPVFNGSAAIDLRSMATSPAKVDLAAVEVWSTWRSWRPMKKPKKPNKNGDVMGYHGISTNNQASGTDRIWYVYTYNIHSNSYVHMSYRHCWRVSTGAREETDPPLCRRGHANQPSGNPSWQWDIHGNSVEVEVFDGKIRELKIIIFGKLCPCLLVIPPSTTSPFIIMTGHSLAPLFSLVGSFKSPGNSMLAKSKSPESDYILLRFIGYTPFVCSSFF